MKTGKAKSLIFFLVICLILAALITTFIAVNRGTGGFMTRAAKPFDCSGITYLGKKFCNAKNLCKWRDDSRITTKGSCISKVNDLSKDSGCANVGAVCCTNTSTGQGYCNGAVTCNPTNYTCVASQTGLGQERGAKGTCSTRFPGSKCNWNSVCDSQGGTHQKGYCKGPAEWTCCTPKSGDTIPVTE